LGYDTSMLYEVPSFEENLIALTISYYDYRSWYYSLPNVSTPTTKVSADLGDAGVFLDFDSVTNKLTFTNQSIYYVNLTLIDTESNLEADFELTVELIFD